MSTKKIFRILTALMFVVCTIFTLSSCEALDSILSNLPELPGLSKKECAHTMEETAAKAASCEEDGNIQYFTCSTCNNVYLDKDGKTKTTLAETVVAKTGHNSGDWMIDREANCTQVGAKHKECTVCGEVIATDSIPAKGHTEVIDAAVAATCTTAGKTQGKHCSVCNEVLVEQTVVGALGHNTDGVVAHKDATCTEAGVVGGTYCTRCELGKTDAEATIDALGHNTNGVVEAKAPTCTEAGVVGGVYCTACNEGKSAAEAAIDALGHDMDDGEITTAPTCTEAGVKTYTCERNCGHTTTEAVAALGHDMDDGEITTAPTCTEAGVKTYTCERNCGHTTTEAVAALGHDMDDGEITTAPTCTEAGVKTFTCERNCGHTTTEAVAALGHDMDDGVITTAPTCTTTGIKTYTCKNNCGHTTTEEIAVSHDIVVTEGKAATCYENGYTASEYCRLCDYAVESVVILGGHKGIWVSTDASYEQRACSTCGRIEKREKNNVIDFEGDAILSNNKLSVAVGALTGEGDASVAAGAGLTEFGNARDKFSLVSDAEGKVLKVVLKTNANYAASTVRVDLTDPLHSTGTGEDGGKYLVFEFDIKFDELEFTNNSKIMFSIYGYEALGSNWLYNIPFYSYIGKVRVGPTAYVVNEEDSSIDTWFTFRAVTELIDGASGNAVTKFYYKVKGADGPMTYLASSQRPSDNTYGTVNRTNVHYAQFHIGSNDYDYTYYLDNASLIRTADANYSYCSCDHVMSDWTTESEAVACTTDGVAKRSCTKAGCGYTETEYLPAHKLVTTPGKAATCFAAGYTAYQTCTACQKVIGKTDVPALAHKLTDWVIEGDTQKKTCQNNCGYYELRTTATNAPITFDDGTVTSGDKLEFNNMATLSDDNKTATVNNGFALYSVSADAPDRIGANALLVQTDNSKWASGKDAMITVPTTDGSTEGNVYTFDFDMYIIPGANATNNSSRVVIQFYFGGYAFAMGTYGSRVTKYASSLNFGTTNSWISFRFIVKTIENGKAQLELFVKDAQGNYISKFTSEITGSGIKADGLSAVTFSSYVSGGSFTYYLDNISLTRHTSGIAECDHVLDDGTVTIDPTCDTMGEMTYLCSKCGREVTETIDALGHDTVNVAEKAATCTEAGHSAYTACSRCNYTDGKTVFPTLGHDMSDWVNIGNNTDRRDCSRCDYAEEKPANCDVHTPGAIATCETAQICTVCGATLAPALGHDLDNGLILIAPGCNNTGVIQYYCQRGGCIYTTAKELAPQHSLAEAEGKDATCYKDGVTAYKYCTLCSYTENKNVIPGGHKGSWVSINDNYEQITCTDCGRKQVREKNNPIDLDGDAILSNGKLAITVGSGDGAIYAATGLTEFGNARDKFTLKGDASNKVLQIIGKKNASFGASVVRVNLTDSLHKANANEDGGQYLVFDFDMKFDAFTGTNTGKIIFTLYCYEALGGNWLANFPFYNYLGKLRVGTTNYVTDENGQYANVWFTFRMVTTLVNDSTGTSTTTLYYKVRGADDATYTALGTSSRAGSYGTVGRTDNHNVQFQIGANDSDYTYYLDNLSFIRTNEAKYTYNTCAHEIRETVTKTPTYTEDGIVERRCTKDGCGYVETEYLPATFNSEEYDLIEYGPEYIHTSGNMGTTSKLVAGRADILGDKHLVFTAKVISFEGIRIGHGYHDYNAAYMEIDNTHVRVYRYFKELTMVSEQAHGLTIADDIKVTIDVDNHWNANIVISSGDQSFSFTVKSNWGGSNGEIHAASLGSILAGAQVAFTCDGYDRDIHFYGDSYLSVSSDRWLYYADHDSHSNALFDGYGGRASGGAYASLLENLKHSTPEIVVWMLGMNDGSDKDINTPSAGWATIRDKLIALSEEYGFELIFTTIPTVPNINHEAKNKWIKESGYRYIDMAAGVGADGTGKWIDGYLHSDEVHPTHAGAAAIYKQVAKDFPELAGKEYEGTVTEVSHTVTVLDTMDRPIMGAVVKLIPKSGDAIEMTTDANGQINIDLAGKWKAQLISVPAAYHATDAQLGEQLSFSSAKLTITVANATYKFTVTNASGALYENATISLYALINGEPDMSCAVATATTDANGTAYIYLEGGANVYRLVCSLDNVDGYYVKDGYTYSNVNGYVLSVVAIPEVSSNRITAAETKDGAIELTYKDGTTQSLGALDLREGYNSAAVSYELDGATGVLTVTLIDSAYFNFANQMLEESGLMMTVCLREMNGKLEWASESMDDWTVLCDAVTTDKPLVLLAAATEFGKQEAITSESMVFAIKGNSLRFRTLEWKDGTDLVIDAVLHYATSNNMFNLKYIAEIPSNVSHGFTDAGASYNIFKTSDDDIAPINFNGSYNGANHGYNVIASVANTAGITTEDIGSIWQVGSMQYVIVKATDTVIWFCPYYDSAMKTGSFSYTKIAKDSTITHVSGATHTASFTASADSTQQQFYRSMNHSYQAVYLNGTKEIDLAKDGYYYAEFIDFYEEYDIIYLPAILEYLIANVGNNDNDSYHDESITESYVTFHNTYRFHKNGACVIYSSYEFHKSVDIGYIGGVQSIKFNESTHYVYVPGTTELSTPTLQGTSATADKNIYVTKDKLEDPDTLASSYFQMSDENGTKVMNLGYNQLYGVGANDVRDYLTSNDLGWYYTSYKMYPRIISNCRLAAGAKIDFIAYRIPSYVLDDDFIAINWYWVGDDIYLSLHTDKSLDKTVTVLPDYMNGMEVSLVEGSDSFMVNSAAIEDGSISVTSNGAGYVVLKLTNP